MFPSNIKYSHQSVVSIFNKYLHQIWTHRSITLGPAIVYFRYWIQTNYILTTEPNCYLIQCRKPFPLKNNVAVFNSPDILYYYFTPFLEIISIFFLFITYILTSCLSHALIRVETHFSRVPKFFFRRTQIKIRLYRWYGAKDIPVIPIYFPIHAFFFRY